MRVLSVIFLSFSLSACGSFSPFDYVATGVQLASNPAELVQTYYEKIKEDRRLDLERKNRLKLKASFDLQECGAVYFWLKTYYANNGGAHFSDEASLTRKYEATGIDRNFLNRVVHARLGDGKQRLALGNLPDLHWIMDSKRLCDEVYFDRLVSNPKFERPADQPSLYEIGARR